VINDSPELLELAEILLRDEDFDVKVALTGSRALDLVRTTLPDLVIRTKETGMHVDLMGAQDLGDDIPLGVERTIYRLVQESLTNAAKHAAGSDVEVRLERWATEIRVTITNTAPPRPKVTLPGGRVGGGLAGKGVAETVNPTAEDTYWRENYASRPYYDSSSTYDDYRPAYQHGWEARGRYADQSFDEIEPDLEREWSSNRAHSSKLSWQKAKLASRDAWDRLTNR